MSDLWAYCHGCERWFYCATDLDGALSDPACPVCQGVASLIEDRAGAGAA